LTQAKRVQDLRAWRPPQSDDSDIS
jgi:hypothetical protein